MRESLTPHQTFCQSVVLEFERVEVVCMKKKKKTQAEEEEKLKESASICLATHSL